MADEKGRITILNQRAGKVDIGPDPEELKKNPKAKSRVLQSGESISVSADEAPRLLRHKMLVDAAKILQGAESPEVKRLKAELEAEKARNARLEEAASKRAAGGKSDEEKAAEAEAAEKAKAEKEAAKAAAAERKAIMKKGAKVLTQAGDKGVVTKVHPGKKGPADDAVDVLLSNGNTSRFDVSALKLDAESAAS